MLRRISWLLFALTLAAGGMLAWIAMPPPERTIVFPGGRTFALSIVDDTDLTSLDRVRPIYDLLHEVGMRTTKTVWVYAGTEQHNSANHGDTLQDPAYAQWVQELQARGFEIASHGPRGGTSTREEIRAGLDEFR